MAVSQQEEISHTIDAFQERLPYRDLPYSRRSWGHPFHKLCSYQGKLKPSIAHWLVRLFTKEGDVVLDPLGGVGTVAFEACAQGRLGITNDLSPLAYAVATAKVSPPGIEACESELSNLEDFVGKAELTKGDLEAAEFGLNAKVSDYFHKDTLLEILKVRKYFLDLETMSEAQAFIKANLLHIMHGNRPYALSRTSHPITPFNPSGPFVYKPVLKKLRARVLAMLNVPLPFNFRKGKSFNFDFRALPEWVSEVDAIVTSPPFPGLRFDRPNWMRMWFCGWNANDFHVTHKAFLESQQAKSMKVYKEFFATCTSLLRRGGIVVLHTGRTQDYSMFGDLLQYTGSELKLVGRASESVENVENHGMSDKGTTKFHDFAFFTKASTDREVTGP